MIFPRFSKIVKTDYKQEYQDLVDQLSFPINTAMQNLTTLLSKRVSLKDNIQCTLKKITVEVDSRGAPLNPVSFQLDVSGSLYGIDVKNVINNTNSNVFPTGTPFISWTVTSTGISITNIAGLPSGNKFSLDIVAWII